MKSKSTLSLAVLAAAALLAGCASSVKLDDPAPVSTLTAKPVDGSTAGGKPGTASGTTPQSQVASVDLTKSGGTPAANGAARVVYFDFDSFAIKDEYKGLVETHAKTLTTAKQRRMVVEGHADERGSREYNLALGQKRAEAVVKSLALLGVGQAQVEAVSFGEERPAATGSTEEAWAKNRRAELKDR